MRCQVLSVDLRSVESAEGVGTLGSRIHTLLDNGLGLCQIFIGECISVSLMWNFQRLVLKMLKVQSDGLFWLEGLESGRFSFSEWGQQLEPIEGASSGFSSRVVLPFSGIEGKRNTISFCRQLKHAF